MIPEGYDMTLICMYHENEENKKTQKNICFLHMGIELIR